ncbi:unnamed protein product [Parnassius apollo]|uniref:(apollo) hypothetical protein n=1 Tax=Parnassius apollo TaxID=110799 RepID=A0A8S3W9D3_PARAO|nr:unnamed protein product [Parnassius apollo]
MSFNLDDPLADILSDGSDDSFFDDDVLGKKKSLKKKSTPIVEKKNILFDLDGSGSKTKPNDFNLEKVNKPLTKADDSEILLKADSQKSNSSSFKYATTKEAKKIELPDSNNVLNNKVDIKSPLKTKVGTSVDKMDILDELVGAKKEQVKHLDKAKGSQSILDDILGKTAPKLNHTTKSTTVKNQEYNLNSILGKNEPKETFSTKKTNSVNKLQQNESIKQNKKKSDEDWLGIFQDKDENIEEDGNEMPSWLGGSSLKTKTSDKDNKSRNQKEVEETLSHIPQSKENETVTKEEAVKEKMKEIKSDRGFEKIITTVPDNAEVQKDSEDVTIQGTAVYLQQQEAQLMVALQLKAQDEKLAAMQQKQKEAQRVQREAALAQHAQLDAMLQRQANHRLQMQAIINAHQDRIAQRIKELLGSNDIVQDDADDLAYSSEIGPKGNEESPRNKEKKQLLQLIQSLQENHDKEINIMETSYRRQIAYLEISLSQTEERMKEESDKVVKFYMEKISWLEEHHHLYKKWMEENTSSLIERHNAEKEMLRKQHLEDVNVLQEHHSALMENIKNAVKQEQVLIQDSAGFSTDMQHLIVDIKENKIKCQQLVEKVETLTGNTQREAERSLQLRETQVNDMIQQMKKEREHFEKEKTESKDMIHMLEVRLKQMTTMIEEDSVSLKQKKMEFEFEKATFSKQTEFAKNVLKKQDEELKMFKEDIQKEYQEKVAKINEEKEKAIKDSAIIAKEKASILSIKMDLEKTKAELQAQLEEITEERSKLNLEKQELYLKEQRIIAKSKDVEMLTKAAIEKQSQAEKKYAEAESQQRKYEERIRRIQEHVVSLNAREKQIAREKIVLSRERIRLHNDWKQIESRQQCSLCRSMPRTPQYNLETTYHSENYDMPVSRDYGEANVSHALSAIEQEMAHLMGRTFSLKHDSGLVNLTRQDVRHSNDVEDEGEHLESTETGTFKDYMDPKFMMLRLDVQKVINKIEGKGGSVDEK